jgi:hypothetical protein
MSWFNWFSGNKSNTRADARGVHSDALSSHQMDNTRHASGVRPHGAAAQPAATASAQRLEQRRTERNAKRELLFQVVRESMVRVGVLSSAFKFKVLSLDQRGRSFLVMIELSSEFSGEVEKLAEIETMIAQTAKHRFEIVVQAVYWRYFNASLQHAGAVSAPAPLLGAMHAPVSRPGPLFGMEGPGSSSRPMPLSMPVHAPLSAPVPTPPAAAIELPVIGATSSQLSAAPKAAAKVDELSDDEVAAFRRALAAGAAQGAMAAPTPPKMAAQPVRPAAAGLPVAAKSPPAPNNLEKARSKLLLTGYEDTEMADDDPLPALSGTQYGELR